MGDFYGTGIEIWAGCGPNGQLSCLNIASNILTYETVIYLKWNDTICSTFCCIKKHRLIIYRAVIKSSHGPSVFRACKTIHNSWLKMDSGFEDTSDLCIFMITTKLNHFLEMGTLLPQSAAWWVISPNNFDWNSSHVDVHTGRTIKVTLYMVTKSHRMVN